MPDQIVAKLEITMTENGTCSVAGVGQILQNKAFAYGLLELAKEVIRGQDRRIEPVGMDALSRLS